MIGQGHAAGETQLNQTVFIQNLILKVLLKEDFFYRSDFVEPDIIYSCRNLQ
jgi:hypothetical protein